MRNHLFLRAVGVLAFAGALVACSGDEPSFTPGAPGLGDPYDPLGGNGGYDVDEYHLAIRYDPRSGELAGAATVRAIATQDLSRFNLDLEGLTVDGVRVDGEVAEATRQDTELIITPPRGIRRDEGFEVEVLYHGVPVLPEGGGASFGTWSGGFQRGTDEVAVFGEPKVAATWYPVNDHPRDAARYALEITVPEGYDAISVGEHLGTETHDGWTTWSWRAAEPMVSYALGFVVGRYTVREYEVDGVRFLEAVSASLEEPRFAPKTGARFAYARPAARGYQRLTRTLAVPASGGELRFWAQRGQYGGDSFIVEAHVVGSDAWTTLPDRAGFARQDNGVCPAFFLHPFLSHYVTPQSDAGCTPRGTTGEWWAATGTSVDWEEWVVDLSRYAGQTVEVALAAVSGGLGLRDGVAIDDLTFTTHEGDTSFEDGDTGGWLLSAPPPPGSPNARGWIAAAVDDLPPPHATLIAQHLARLPEIYRFLAEQFGPYPFRDAGAIVHDVRRGSLALEVQTRPIYRGRDVSDPGGTFLIVHETAHQWFGDHVRVDGWQHMWLNEGFATYAEWLWEERELGTPVDATFEDMLETFPEGDPFWEVVIGDPGKPLTFSYEVYARGAMTLHALRRAVGDEDFFTILRAWTAEPHTATSEQFIALAEEISGMDLDPLFAAWLFTPARPNDAR